MSTSRRGPTGQVPEAKAGVSLVVAVWAGLGVVSGEARAQVSETSSVSGSSSSSSLEAEPPSLSDRARAIELFRASQDAYQTGRFLDAATALEEAYRLDPDPILLYNLARAWESEGDAARAVEAYRRYLAAAPDARDRPAVEARIRALERRLEDRARLEALLEAERRAKVAAAEEAERARREAEALASARAAEARAKGPPVLPWVTAGLGAAGLAAGGVLGVLALDRQDAAVQEPTQAEAARLADEAGGLASGANIAYAAGGTLLAVGLLWAWLAAEGDDADGRPALILREGGAAVAGRF